MNDRFNSGLFGPFRNRCSTNSNPHDSIGWRHFVGCCKVSSFVVHHVGHDIKSTGEADQIIILPTMLSFLIVISLDFFLFSVQQTKTRHSIFLYIPTTAAATAIFIFLSTPAATVQCQVPNCAAVESFRGGEKPVLLLIFTFFFIIFCSILSQLSLTAFR